MNLPTCRECVFFDTDIEACVAETEAGETYEDRQACRHFSHLDESIGLLDLTMYVYFSLFPPKMHQRHSDGNEMAN